MQTAGTPFTHKFAALNSPLGYGGAYGAQPPTHTFTDVTNIVNVFTNATYGTAPPDASGPGMYPSGVLKSLDFCGNAEQLLTSRCTGDSWLSVTAGTAVTNVTTELAARSRTGTPPSSSRATPSPRPGPMPGIGNFTPQFKRQTQVYWIVAGTQTPYIIARGPLTMDGQVDWDPTNSETPLDLMLLNAKPR